jgi:hypothetical protein
LPATHQRLSVHSPRLHASTTRSTTAVHCLASWMKLRRPKAVVGYSSNSSSSSSSSQASTPSSSTSASRTRPRPQHTGRRLLRTASRRRFLRCRRRCSNRQQMLSLCTDVRRYPKRPLTQRYRRWSALRGPSSLAAIPVQMMWCLAQRSQAATHPSLASRR